MRVVVTGAGGLLGGRLAELLHRQGLDVAGGPARDTGAEGAAQRERRPARGRRTRPAARPGTTRSGAPRGRARQGRRLPAATGACPGGQRHAARRRGQAVPGARTAAGRALHRPRVRRRAGSLRTRRRAPAARRLWRAPSGTESGPSSMPSPTPPWPASPSSAAVATARAAPPASRSPGRCGPAGSVRLFTDEYRDADRCRVGGRRRAEAVARRRPAGSSTSAGRSGCRATSSACASRAPSVSMRHS